MCIEFTSFSEYLLSRKTLIERINGIDELINIMIAKQADILINTDVNINEYWLNDGQVQIKTSYRSPAELTKAIEGLEKTKQLYLNQLNGRKTILRDRSSL